MELNKEIFTLPFIDANGVYIFDSKNNMCLMWSDEGLRSVSQENKIRLIRVLNGDKTVKDFNKYKKKFTINNKGEIFFNDNCILIVRGWGRLQYLPNPEKLQDDFSKWVIETLNTY